MRKVIRLGALKLFFGLVFLSAPVNEVSSYDKGECAFGRIALPDRAHDVTKTCMHDVDAAQVDFLIDVPYQAVTIHDFYKSHYASRGWHQCTPETGWHKILKRVDGLKEIERRFTVFSNPDQGDLLLVSLRYLLREYEDGSWLSSASKDIQKVRVVLYDLSKTTLAKDIEMLEISCGDSADGATTRDNEMPARP